MSNLDHSLTTGFVPVARRNRRPVIHRTLLVLIMALAELLVAASTVFLCALVYHIVFLHETLPQFAGVFYARYAAFAGFLYGGFSTFAHTRFLDRRRVPHLRAADALYAWTATVASTLLVAFLLGEIGTLSRVSLTSAYVIGLPLTVTARELIQSGIASRIASGALRFEHISVVGSRVDVLNFLINGDLWRNGHRLTSTLYLEDARDEDGVVDTDAIIRFAAATLRSGTDHIVFVGSLTEFDQLQKAIAQLKRFALNVLYSPSTLDPCLKALDVVALGPNNVLRFLRTPMSDVSVLLKRTMDVVGAGLGLALLSPVLLLAALAVKLDSPGSIIYRQARRGFNGETFMIWKFRSMSVTESGYGMRQVERNDRRVTRVGALLRRTSIDELPQLFNVLMGQMSLVGPRPHAISHDEELARSVATYAHRQRIKPGITGWAQVNGYRGETTTPEQIEGRVAHDIYYIDHWSVFLDIWTVALTIFSPATRRNAF